MGLDPTRELTATVTGDGHTELRLVGAWRGAKVEVTAGPSSEVVMPAGDTLTLLTGLPR